MARRDTGSNRTLAGNGDKRRDATAETFPLQLHANDLIVGELLQPRVQVLPPLEQLRLADELKPRRDLRRGVSEDSPKVIGRDVFRVPDLVGADVKVDVGLDEENVVNYTIACVSKKYPLRQLNSYRLSNLG